MDGKYYYEVSPYQCENIILHESEKEKYKKVNFFYR